NDSHGDVLPHHCSAARWSAAAPSALACCSGCASQLPLERLIEDGRQHGVQLGGGLGLERLHGIDLGLQGVEFGDNVVLLSQRWEGNLQALNIFSAYARHRRCGDRIPEVPQAVLNDIPEVQRPQFVASWSEGE